MFVFKTVVVGCVLFVVCCLLSAVNCESFVVICWLSVARNALFVV